MGQELSSPISGSSPSRALWRGGLTQTDLDYFPITKYGFPEKVMQIDVHHSKKLAAASDASNTIRVYQLLNNTNCSPMELKMSTPKPTLPRHVICFLSFKQSGDENITLLAATGDGMVEQWDVTTGNSLGLVNLAENWKVTPCAYWRLPRYDGRFILAGCDDNTVRVFETQSFAPGIPIIEKTGDDCEILALETSPVEPKCLLVGCANGKAVVCDIETGKKLSERSSVKTVGAGIFAVAWREDGEVFATAGDDGHIIFHSLSKKKSTNDLPLGVVQFLSEPKMKVSQIQLNWLISETSDPNDFGDILAITAFSDSPLTMSCWISGNTFKKIEDRASFFPSLDAAASISFCYAQTDPVQDEKSNSLDSYMITGESNTISLQNSKLSSAITLDASEMGKNSQFQKIYVDNEDSLLDHFLNDIRTWILMSSCPSSLSQLQALNVEECVETLV